MEATVMEEEVTTMIPTNKVTTHPAIISMEMVEVNMAMPNNKDSPVHVEIAVPVSV